jgi:glycosyltransferase involved in cell wall biosynthesis
MGNCNLVEHPRILIATDNLRDQINGVAITFKHLDAMSKQHGYSMHFVDPSQFSHFALPSYKEVKLAFPYGIGRKIQDIRPDYIHIATEGPIGLATKMYCDRNGLKYNTSYHTKFPEYMKSLHGIPVSWTYAYLRWFHKHSGVVMTTTSSMKSLLLENGFKENVIEWTRGVDVSQLEGLERKPNGSVLFVGRVSKEKNLEELLVLQDKYNIVIVGDGPDRIHLEKKYTKAKFVGYKTGKELFQYYLDASVFCFPSKTDTFGIVIVEAMSAGTPVAAFPVIGPIDVVENGKTGFLDDNLEIAIEKCFALGRIHSKAWSWKHCWEIFKDNLICSTTTQKTI